LLYIKKTAAGNSLPAAGGERQASFFLALGQSGWFKKEFFSACLGAKKEGKKNWGGKKLFAFQPYITEPPWQAPKQSFLI
jgi:hypothetical protein